MVNLADLDSLYNETKAAPDLDFLPAGTYQGHIVECHMKETRDSGFPMLELKLKVAAGQYSGRIEFFRITFRDTPDSMKFAKRDLVKLGYKGALSQLDANLEDFLGLGIEFKVAEKMKNGEMNRNVYLNKQITVASGGDGYEMPPIDIRPPAEDELPF
jgi:hypothetical protein